MSLENKSIKIAVLMACHNRKDKTVTCLETLFKAYLPVHHEINVFLVDDNSSDGTADAVAENYPQVNIIQGSGELYWNRGMHLAWKKASEFYDFDYYLWLNDDVVLFEDFLSKLLLSSQKKEGAIICGVTCSEKNKEMTYGGRDSQGIMLEPNGNEQVCHIFNGNIVLIPRSAFQVVGNLNIKFPHALGDFDYSMRAKAKGVKSYISTEYLGYCEKHENVALWCRPETPLLKRVKILYSPLGCHPYHFYLYENEHFGFFLAVKHYVSIHLRAFFPSMWKSDV